MKDVEYEPKEQSYPDLSRDDIASSRSLQTDAGDIVYAACLAHDLGNPPFGHIGEHAIQTWFEKLRDSSIHKHLFEDKRFSDFLHFDGNAQGFRILTRLTGWRGKGGLQLSYATVGAFSKYPYSAIEVDTGKIRKKKFGYMHHDKRAAMQIYDGLGLVRDKANVDAAASEPAHYCRHPLAYIVEAADDICYLTTDIEDAGRMHLLSFNECEMLLRRIAETKSHMPRYNQIPPERNIDRIG